MRQRIVKKSLSIPNDKQSDIDQNVREIRAVLKTNEEILDRCIPSAEYETYTNPSLIEFVRRQFNTVRISHNTESSKRRKFAYEISSDNSAQSSSPIEKTVISAKSYSERKIFNASVLTDVPDTLAKFIRPTFKDKVVISGCKLIDYEEYFDNSLTLHDDVLAQFLVHLKEHLISVQVFLGEIDTWLMESDESRGILTEIFGDISYQVPDFQDTTTISGSRISTRNHVLKEFIISGNYNAKFDISVEKERQRLKKLIEFLST